jgi:hypothetical protein
MEVSIFLQAKVFHIPGTTKIQATEDFVKNLPLSLQASVFIPQKFCHTANLTFCRL